MRQIKILINYNLKLLLRNQGFLFFLFALPMLSLFILNIKEEDLVKNEGKNERQINELESADAQVIDLTDSFSYTIKVYDSSHSKLADYALNQLIDTGMFEVYRYHSSSMTEKEIVEHANENSRNDRIGCILYLSPEFEEDILSGKLEDGSVVMFDSSEDERKELFEASFRQNMSILLRYSGISNGDVNQLLGNLKWETDKLQTKDVRRISGDDEITLTYEQKKQKTHIGYSYAILTLSFLFCGIFIAYSVIDERDNHIFSRFTLSNIGFHPYFISKLTVSVLISLIQTVIIGIGLLMIKPDFGIGMVSYLFLVTLLGNIFNILSLCIGVVLGNAMGANYAALTIWILSTLLSGLYFAIEYSSAALKGISYLMPQKWFLKAAEMIMTGDGSAYLMTIGITAAFLIFILSLGAAGLRLRNEV